MSSPVALSSSLTSVPVSSTNAVAPSGGAGGSAVPSVATLMTEPQHVDVGTAIAQMMVENAFASRKQARAERQHANTAMITAQQAQIKHMREEADKRFDAAKVDAWAKIAEGGFGVAGGVMSAGAFESPNGVNKQQSEGYGSALSAAGKLGSGVIGQFSAGYRHDADRLSVAAKSDEMSATAQKNALESADDAIKEARDHARTAMDFLRDWQATEAKSLSSALKA